MKDTFSGIMGTRLSKRVIHNRRRGMGLKARSIQRYASGKGI